MPKFIYCMLLVMLCLVLVFTAFAIPYSENNFFGMVLTAEHALDGASTWVMNGFSKIRNFVDKVSNFISNNSDVFTGFSSWLEYFNFLSEEFQSLKDSISIYFSYFGHYGLHNIFTSDYWEKLSYLDKMKSSSLLVNEDGSIDFLLLDSLYVSLKNGETLEEFEYIRLDYEVYLKECYNSAVRNVATDYDLLFLTRRDISANSLSVSYDNLISSDGAFICVKIPSLNFEFDSERFLGLYTERQFYIDMLTKFKYPIFASSFVADSSEVGRDDVKPIYVSFQYVKNYLDFHSGYLDFTLSSGDLTTTYFVFDDFSDGDDEWAIFDVFFEFYVDHTTYYYNGYSCYLNYIKDNNIKIPISDFARSVYCYRISKDILVYDTDSKITEALS